MNNLTDIFAADRRIAYITGLIIFTLWSSTIAATSYKYDTQHRLSIVVYGDGRIISYKYDASGNRIEQVSTLMADTSVDGEVSFTDFAVLASRWLDTDCAGPDWCDGADINHSGQVNLEDLAIIAEQWLENIQ